MKKDSIEIKPCKKVDTKDMQGQPNGMLLEILNELDGFGLGFKGQVYLTVTKKGEEKGYHIHALATYHITCIKGRIQSTIYTDKDHKEVIEMGDGDFKTIKYSPGGAHLMKNVGNEDAYVIVYRDVPWSPEVGEQLDIEPERIETDDAWQEIEEFNKKFQ